MTAPVAGHQPSGVGVFSKLTSSPATSVVTHSEKNIKFGVRNVTMQTELLASPNYTRWYTSGDMEPNIPEDPRYWTRNDVATWLQHMGALHQLPAIPTDRFIMNGKALCLMTVTMFLDRVPLGGKLLYKDFQLRLARAMYNAELYHS